MPKWLQQELPDIKKSTAAAWIYRRYDISLRDFLKITLSGIGLLLITADIFYHNLLAAAVLCPYLHFRLKIKSEELHKQRRERLKMQFKDGMQSVAFSLNSGYSIENAWKEAIVEMRLLYGENSEIVTEFQRIINRLERNENIEDVLEEFAKKSGVADIEYFAAVFRYAKRYGGDLIAIIRHTAETIREKNETYNEIQTIISGKKMEQKYQGVVLTTAHSSKGLEWKAVFNSISGYDSASLHTSGPKHQKKVEEARRLLFVSMTRARDLLYITGQYVAYGPKDDRTYNQFLREVFEAEDIPYCPVDPNEGLRAQERKKRAATRRSSREAGSHEMTDAQKAEYNRQVKGASQLSIFDALDSYLKNQAAHD